MSLLFKKGLMTDTMEESTLDSILSEISKDITIGATTVFLDAGCGEGDVLKLVKEKTEIQRAIGIEIDEDIYNRAVSKHQNIEFHNAAMEESGDLLSQADIVLINNIGIENSDVWKAWDNIKSGAVMIYNNISLSWKLKSRLDHSPRVMRTISGEEYHWVIKK